MAQETKSSPAHIIERFLHRTALGTFLLAITYCLNTAGYLIEGDLADSLALVRKVLGVLVILVVLPPLISAARLGAFKPQGCDEPGDYVVLMLSRAGTMAFSLTFVFLLVVENASAHVFTDQPAAFFISAALAVSLLVFSITFFLLTRDFGEEDAIDEDDA